MLEIVTGREAVRCAREKQKEERFALPQGGLGEISQIWEKVKKFKLSCGCI